MQTYARWEKDGFKVEMRKAGKNDYRVLVNDDEVNRFTQFSPAYYHAANTFRLGRAEWETRLQFAR